MSFTVSSPFAKNMKSILKRVKNEISVMTILEK